MSNATTTAVFLSWLVVLTASAQEQPSPSPKPKKGVIGKLGMGVDPLPVYVFALADSPAVQEEIKLTGPQLDRLKNTRKQLLQQMDQRTRQMRGTLAELRQQPDPQIAEGIRTQFRQDMITLRSDAEEATFKVLQRGQRARLAQIRLQAEGPLAFSRPEVLEQLNLDPIQFERILLVLEHGRQELISGSVVTSPEQGKPIDKKKLKQEVDQKGKKTGQSRDATMRAILQILTKGQRASYQKMLGEPFDLAKLRGGGSTMTGNEPDQ